MPFHMLFVVVCLIACWTSTQALPSVRKHPHLLELSTRPWLYKLSQTYGKPITKLSNVPDAVLDDLAKDAAGYDYVWLMGIWSLGEYGLHYDQTDPGLQAFYSQVLPGWTTADVIGSPYAIVRYQINKELGTASDLLAFRKKLNARGMRLMVDFVPNHLAVDSDWAGNASKQQWFVRAPPGTPTPFDPAWYQPDGTAWGRDPYSGAWLDTSQINYWNSDAAQAMALNLQHAASVADGIRCDMAMLVLNDVIEQTWGSQMQGNHFTRPSTEFWQWAIQGARKINPDLIVMAEARKMERKIGGKRGLQVYWGLDGKLLSLGFDYTYDKTLYDHLAAFDYDGIHSWVAQPLPGYFAGAAHFVANHDEAPACDEFKTCEQSCAAAAITYTLPGLRFVWQDQVNGPHARLAVQLRRRSTESANTHVQKFMEKLLDLVNDPCFHEGEFRVLSINNTFVFAWSWSTPSDHRLVVVNYSDQVRGGNVVIPDAQPVNGKDTITVTDLWNNKSYQRSATQMRTTGLVVVIPPWEPQIFKY